MSKLTNEELHNVEGGAFKTALIILGASIFAWGVIDGYVRPNKCKK